MNSQPNFKISIDQIERLIKILANEDIDKAMMLLLEWKRDYKKFHEALNEVKLDASIKVLFLSSRAYNCLINSDVLIIQDLLDMPDEHLWKIKNFGRHCIEEVLVIKEELKKKFAQ